MTKTKEGIVDPPPTEKPYLPKNNLLMAPYDFTTLASPLAPPPPVLQMYSLFIRFQCVECVECDCSVTLCHPLQAVRFLRPTLSRVWIVRLRRRHHQTRPIGLYMRSRTSSRLSLMVGARVLPPCLQGNAKVAIVFHSDNTKYRTNEVLYSFHIAITLTVYNEL